MIRLLSVGVLTICAWGAVAAQARVASAPAEPSLLNITSGWARASILGDLRDARLRSDHLELRVWRGFGLAETQGFVLRRVDGHWSAFLARVIRCESQVPAVVYDTASATTKRGFVIEARRNCGQSVSAGPGSRIIAADTLVVQRFDRTEAEIESVWKEAESAGVARLPSRVKRTWTRDDGVMFVIELRRGDEYRATEVDDVDPPEVDADAQVKRIVASLQRLAP